MDDADDHWLARARDGDAQAFRCLVDAHARPLHRLCARIVHDPVLAEDAVQEAFYRAWRGLAEFDGRSAFSTWLHRISVNAALELLRRNARHRHELHETDDDDEGDFLAGFEGDAPGPQEHARSAEINRCIQQQLGRMSATERAAFVMRHCEGESLDTIGATLDLNIGQAKQAIFRAVRKLRGALQPLR